MIDKKNVTWYHANKKYSRRQTMNEKKYPSQSYEYKKKYNEKYLAKLVQTQFRVTPEEKAQIEEMAAQAGKSVNQFIKDKIFGNS